MKFARTILLFGFVVALVGCSKPKVEPATVVGLEKDAKQTYVFENETFEAPIMLMAGGEPMEAGYSYPSPAIFDVDNDGQDEMVLGEIMGTLSVCDNENKSSGDPQWSSAAPLLAADGEPLQLNNW